MDSDIRTAAVVDAQSGVSWAAIAAGAVATAALTLLLIAFGAGLGLSAISPWTNTGVSASAFKAGTGIYIVIVAVMSSAVGGYLAARLRTKWSGLNTQEVFFRDTAHGFLAWAFATLITASALSSATAYLANGAATGLAAASAQGTRSIDPAQVYVDKLFRTGTTGPTAASAPPASAPAATPPGDANSNEMRASVLRLWTFDMRNSNGFDSVDKAYVTSVVAARTGLSQADAEKRVDAVGSSRVDLQACKLEYSIVSPK